MLTTIPSVSSFLRESHPCLQTDDYVFVSDRCKGLCNGVANLFPRALHRACAQHIQRNIQHHAGVAAKDWFKHKLLYAATKEAWQEHYLALKDVSEKAHEYLKPDGNIPPSLYCDAFFEGTTFGRVSSNIGTLTILWSTYPHSLQTIINL